MTILQNWHEKAGVLIEALPYMRRYAGCSVLVKFGGHAMGEQEYVNAFAADMMLLRQVGTRPIIVHGGGPQIGKMLEKLNIETNFVNGLRVTDEATISVVEMVLAGAINKSLVASINAAGGCAVGLSGKDGNLITATKLTSQSENDGQAIDLGFVGKPETVNTAVIDALMGAEMIPVVAPIGLGIDGHTYNINADTAAARLLARLGQPGF